MAKSKDLTGQRFGNLSAVHMSEERKNNRIAWVCRCDCGNVTVVESRSLRSGATKSCGCLKIEKAREAGRKVGKSSKGRGRAKNLTAMRFGRLVALRPTEERRNGNVVWECRCHCGKTVYVSTGNLMRGSSASCGCLRKENAGRKTT